MIKIVNRRTYRGESAYVGRPGVLGNPYKIGRDGSRDEVIQKYRRWLWNQIQRGTGPVYDEIHRLADLAKTDDLTLGCWPAPSNSV